MPKITQNTIHRRPRSAKGSRSRSKISTATRRDKLTARIISEVRNSEYEVALSKCEIKERNGLWYVIPTNAPIGVGMYAYKTISEAIDASRQI
jgi:hypothetical protein